VKTRKSLEKFKRDPLVRVLGMSITKGANGLNLTEATHVVLVEPTLNPAAEAQAVGMFDAESSPFLFCALTRLRYRSHSSYWTN
jgi:hypothetical protein